MRTRSHTRERRNGEESTKGGTKSGTEGEHALFALYANPSSPPWWLCCPHLEEARHYPWVCLSRPFGVVAGGAILPPSVTQDDIRILRSCLLQSIMHGVTRPLKAAPWPECSQNRLHRGHPDHSMARHVAPRHFALVALLLCLLNVSTHTLTLDATS